ncbi:MAG: cysteine hydrolase [Desulfobacterales bacterium]|jgi:nicotinamidase-related amidase|nr:cysteine hydrolase [Desulfobacterales bacterium]
MESHALVLVDLQNDYFPGGLMELEGAEPAAGQAALLLRHFRGRSRPIFHVRHVAERPGATFFLPGTPGAEIHPLVAPAAAEPVVVKHFPNSFRDTDLLERLRGAGVAEVTICGAMSHMCIDATARAAADLGFACRVAHDACATRALAFGAVTVPAAQVHAAYMAALSAAYAQVLATAELLAAA